MLWNRESYLERELKKCKQRNEALRKALKRLLVEMGIDRLTGLRTRSGAEEELEDILRDESFTSALVLLEVDGLKEIIGELGRPAGDDVLRAVGLILLETTPRADIPFRSEGAELGVIYVSTDEDRLPKMLEEIRTAITRLTFPKHSRIRVTASLGAIIPRREQPIEDIFRCARIALCASKKFGGDRATIYCSDLYCD